MSLRLIVCCDSNPAPYAAGQDWPCRAWLPVNTENELIARRKAILQGWTVAHVVTPEEDRYTYTCPACARALAALTGSTHP